MFSTKFKRTTVLRILSGKNTLAELSRELGVGLGLRVLTSAADPAAGPGMIQPKDSNREDRRIG